MTYHTDERLKGFLDTNQLSRERMCLAVLAIDRRFTNVKPRHPRGGPDGGRDIEATFEGTQKVFGAVGFLNQANDSDEHKKRAAVKFNDDLESAKAAEPNLDVFIFFTNVNLTVSEKDALVCQAHSRNIRHCEIFDRERIRIALDGPDGLSIRFQYLQIPLSEAEQAAFFSRWGADIQGLISEGFNKLEKTLSRLQFLAETNLPIKKFTILLELDREYTGAEIGHYRSFCHLQLKEPKDNVMALIFGSTDDANRTEAKSANDLKPTNQGISRGICGVAWVSKLKSSDIEGITDTSEEKYQPIASSQSIGEDKVRFVRMSFSYDAFIRLPPYLILRDIDEAIFVIFVNRSLADKIKAMHIFANEYKLAEFSSGDLQMDKPIVDVNVPLAFSESELNDKWTRIMHKFSPFGISFSFTTPLRMFSPSEAENSLQ